MTNGDLFAFVFNKVCDVVLGANGIDISDGPKEDSHPKLKDRTPYPPDGHIEILPPVDDVKTLKKREATDKEFWEVM
jgi:hypothetical protein